MNVVSPKLPHGSRELFNALYESPNDLWLTDDLYAAQLPGGISVSVGWFPELDPSGAYEICFYRETYENQIIEPKTTRDLQTVKRIIEDYAAEIDGPPTNTAVSASGSLSGTFPHQNGFPEPRQ
jgi:hypothetical protein